MADKPKRASEYRSEQFELVRNFGSGVDDVFNKLEPLLDDPEALKAIEILERDFRDPESVGPRRVAEFIAGAPDENIQADVVGFVGRVLRRLAGG